MKTFRIAVLLAIGAIGPTPFSHIAAAAGYLSDYEGVQPVEFTVGEDVFRISDRPDLGKMKVLFNPRSALGGQAMFKLFGVGNPDPPKPVVESGAREFLSDTSRSNCKITDAYIVETPVWEAKYDCLVTEKPKPKRPIKR